MPRPEPRTILVHYNVRVPHEDMRTPEEIAGALSAAIRVVVDNSVLSLEISCVLAEEIS